MLFASAGTHELQTVKHLGMVRLAAAVCDLALRREPRLGDAALVAGLVHTLLDNPAASSAAYQQFASLVRPYPAPPASSPFSPASLLAVRSVRPRCSLLGGPSDSNTRAVVSSCLAHPHARYPTLVRGSSGP